MKEFRTQFIISTSLILAVALLAFFGNSVFLKMIIVPTVFFCTLVNLIFSGVLYYLNNKVSVFVSLVIFIISAWLLKIVNSNYDEFENYENWQFYNHQQIISTKLDLIVGKNLSWIQFYLAMILLNTFSSFITLSIKYYNVRKSAKLNLEEENRN